MTQGRLRRHRADGTSAFAAPSLELADTHVALQAISLKISPGLVEHPGLIEHNVELLGRVTAIGFERDLAAQ